MIEILLSRNTSSDNKHDHIDTHRDFSEQSIVFFREKFHKEKYKSYSEWKYTRISIKSIISL